MDRAGIIERMLLVDPRWLLGLIAATLLYCRPSVVRAAGPTTASGMAAATQYTVRLVGATDRSAASFARAVLCGLMVWLAAGLLPLFVQSLRWPLIHDGPIMHYVAWRLLHGAVPYRDVFDMNLPGVYLIHIGILKVLGPSDLGFRLFDLLWLVTTCGLLWRFCYPITGRWAGLAVLLYAAFHLSNGAPGMGQRDYLEFTVLLGGLLMVVRWIERPADRRPAHDPLVADRSPTIQLLGAGLALGFAVMIKPHAALFVVAVAVMVAMAERRSLGQHARRGARSPLAGVVPLCAGASIAPLGCAIWLAAVGALQPFLAISAGVAPLYARMHDRPFMQYVVENWPVWLPCLLAIPAAMIGARPDARRTALVLGVIYGAAHYVLQAKGWMYQLYPLVGFGSALAACAAARRTKDARRETVLAAAAVAVLFIVGVGSWDVRLAGANSLTADTLDTVSALQSDLGARLIPGDTVQSFDTTGGCSHALMRMGRPLATRFLCDFLLYGDPRNPYVRTVQQELMAELLARPPKYVVVNRWGWPDGQYDRIGRFRELNAFIRARYRSEVVRSKYVIYERVDAR